MTRTFPVLLAILLGIIACNSEKPKDATAAKLEKMTPLPLEELKKIRPAELMGSPATALSSDSSSPKTVTASYLLENGNNIRLSIRDCGGEFGARWYESTYLSLLSGKHEDTEVFDFNGGKAIWNCVKDSDLCALWWFTGKRYLVWMSGVNADKEMIKKAAKEVEL